MNTIQEILKQLEKLVIELWHSDDLSRESNFKDGYEIVTETDLKFEEKIINNLNTLAPGVPILSEETNPKLETKNTFFTIDPVDGTSNFSYGLPIYGTQIGLIEDGEATAGLIYLPSFDKMFTAFSGSGAFLNGVPIHVGMNTKRPPMIGISDLRVFSQNINFITRLAWTITKSGARPRMVGCTCFDMAMVACNTYQGKIAVNPKLWDIAPGLAIIREAGGIISMQKEVCIAACNTNVYNALSDCHSRAKHKRLPPRNEIWF